MTDKPIARPNGAGLKPFFTLREIAERWAVSTRSVHRLIAAGQIVPTRFGRLVRIAAAEVARFEARSRL